MPEAGARQAFFEAGLRAYRGGAFFEAHELWEEIWRDAPDSPDRQFVHGLIQVAAAMFKIVEQNKPAPAARLLGRALLRLEAAPAQYRGLDAARLVAEARRTKVALEGLAERREAKPDAAFDRALVPTLATAPL